MEPVLAVLIGCVIYITVFILVNWLKDIFTNWREQICGVFTVFSSVWLIPVVLICTEFGKRERMIKMIELTNAAYWTLIALSVLAGYAINEIIRSIRKGEFFDWDDDTK